MKLFEFNPNEEISISVVADILKIYEFGKREDIEKIPNEYICQRGGRFWTTWTKVFDLRDRIKQISKLEKQNDN